LCRSTDVENGISMGLLRTPGGRPCLLGRTSASYGSSFPIQTPLYLQPGMWNCGTGLLRPAEAAVDAIVACTMGCAVQGDISSSGRHPASLATSRARSRAVQVCRLDLCPGEGLYEASFIGDLWSLGHLDSPCDLDMAEKLNLNPPTFAVTAWALRVGKARETGSGFQCADCLAVRGANAG
jgi:hypothetical protein